MNSVNISGRLTKDSIKQKTTSQIEYVMNSIAVRSNIKDSNGEYRTDFIDIIAWRQQADYLSKYGKKGTRVEIIGKLQQNEYKNKNGEIKKGINVLVVDCECINPSNNKNENYEPQPPSYIVKDKIDNTLLNDSNVKEQYNTDYDLDDEDLPF